MGNRPTRLSKAFLWSGAVLLALSFISGVVLCIGETIRQNTSEPPSWQHTWRIIHGLLTPLICIFFGYLWCLHIPGGWKMKAVRVSGTVVLANMVILILTSVGLYYANQREPYYWAHGITGLILPVTIFCHWVGSRRWIKKIEST